MKHFKEILLTLGATSAECIGESIYWDFWRAEFSTPVQSVTGFYLYLKSSCPKSEATPLNLQNWRHSASNQDYEIIVTPRSDLAKNLVVTKSTFRGKNARTSKQLLLDNFLKGLQWKPLEENTYFVDPSIEEIASNEIHSGAKSFLTKWFLEHEHKNPPLAVLTANGGVGKTTLSRILCSEMQRRDESVIPILIESDQWRSLLQGSFTLDSVWDMALTRRFESAARLVANKTALQVLIREGIFVVVFDGFDELCINPASPYSPKALISELYELLTPEDVSCEAKVLLTTRATYWSSIVEEIDLSKISVFRLREFDNEQKKIYFNNRLKTPAERDSAFRISKDINGGLYEGLQIEHQNQDRLSGVPFILDLIASYVEENENADINPYAPDQLGTLLENICRRENLRQNLEIEPSKQLDIFEEIFRDHPEGINADDLRLFLEIIGGVTDTGVLRRFTNHVLLSANAGDVYGPRYEVLRVYFLARFLANGLNQVTTQSGARKKIAEELSRHSSGKTQLIDWLVDQLRHQDPNQLKLAFKHAVEISRDKDNAEVRRASEMAICHLVCRFIPETDDKQVRVKKLGDLLGADIRTEDLFFTGSVFSGVLRAFDFSNTHFERCTFIDVEFKNCLFSEKSKFVTCSFDGNLEFHNCSGEKDLDLTKDTRMSKEAEYNLNQIRNATSRRELRVSFAEDALNRSLRKFRSGDYGFKVIQYRHRRSGFKPGNPYNERIWEVLESLEIVEPHRISNVDGGGLHIKDDKELRHDVATFLDNGVIRGMLKNVIEEVVA